MARDDTTRLDDAITAEVIRNGLAVAVEEASVVVVRSAHSTFIQEGADACAALLDASAQLVAQSTATSLMHAASLRCSLPSLLEAVPLATMEPGDVFALNDPYRGGIHANDILVFRPIFADRRVAFFAGTLVHVADVGGVAAGGLAALATDTFSEGLALPPVHLARRGEPADEVLRIIGANSRVPEKVLGDVDALVAGVHVITRRVGELLDRYGPAPLERFVAAALDQTERRLRAELDRLPAGIYHGGFTIDGDGVEAGRTFEVRVAVTCGPGSVHVDFAGTAAQSRGAINASRSQTLSGVLYAIRCFVDPSIPMDEGCWRPITTSLPAGSIVNPNPPAACGGRVVTVAAAVEAILDALAGARPELAERGQRADPRVHPRRRPGRRAVAQPLLRVRRARSPGRRRRRRRDRCLLPRRPVRHPPDRAARSRVPTGGARGPAAARQRRARPVARWPRRRDRPRGARRRGLHRARRPHDDPPTRTRRRRVGRRRPVRRGTARRAGRGARPQAGRRGAAPRGPARGPHLRRRRARPRRRPRPRAGCSPTSSPGT